MRTLLYGTNYQLVVYNVNLQKVKLTNSYRVLYANLDQYNLYEALLSDSLFAEQSNIIINLDELSNDELALVAKIKDPSNSHIVAYCSKLDKAKINVLSNYFDIQEFALPSNKAGLLSNVRKYSKELNVVLPEQSLEYLFERYGLNVDLYYNLINLLSIAGMLTPSARQVAYLSSGSDVIVAPWDVLEFLSAKDFTSHINEIRGLEFLPLLSYLSNRFSEIGLILEDPNHRLEINPYSLKTLTPLLNSLTLDQTKSTLKQLAQIEYEYKLNQETGLLHFELFLLEINQKIRNK